MTEESVAAIEAAPETVVTEAPEGTGGQVETPPAEGKPEEKTEGAKRRERRQAEIARLAAERDEANARARAAEAERDKLKARAASVKVPKDEDFADPFDLAAHKASAETERRLYGRDAETADDAAKAAQSRADQLQQAERTALVEDWNDKEAEAKTRYADFDKVVKYGWEPSQTMVDLLLTSEVGPDVAYYLGTNRAVAMQIAAMNQVQAARAIGRIEASLTAPKPRTETNAPTPINPVRGSAGASRDPSKMTASEYAAYRMAGGKV